MPARIRRIAIGIGLEWPYKHHTDVAQGILEYARQHGWVCEFEPFIEPSARVAGSGRLYDGVIARVSRAAASYVKRARIPAVNVWVGSPDRTLPRVVPDQRATGQMAAAHLIEHGFRRFGFLGHVHDHNSELQLLGLQETIAPHGCDCSSHAIARAVRDAHAWRRMQESMLRWARSWRTPIGVFATEDVVCRYLANVCLRLGLRIPDDVALVSCGNTEVLCEHLSPRITSIEHRPVEVGYLAAKLLHRLMDGAPPPPGPVLVRPAGLIARASTDVYAVDDAIAARALRYIADNCARPIGVRDVAAGLPITLRSLERRFRRLRNHTIHEEIMRARVARLKRLLLERDVPIKALAADAGFASVERLFKVFRRHEGTSPGRYRKEHERRRLEP